MKKLLVQPPPISLDSKNIDILPNKYNKLKIFFQQLCTILLPKSDLYTRGHKNQDLCYSTYTQVQQQT